MIVHKFKNYEYWPSGVFYGLIFPYLSFWAVRTKSLVYFTNVNPMLPDSGMVNYSKAHVAQLLPEQYKAKHIIVNAGDSLKTDIDFPVICKPVRGERGRGVVKIENRATLDSFLSNVTQDYIVEEFINMPNEAGIFFVKLPGEKGMVTSVTTKSFLTVTGDGTSSIRSLMELDPRAQMQISRLDAKLLDSVPSTKVSVIIEPIGNHNRGTKFINSNALIDQQLHEVFRRVSNLISGFNFGRYDIKYNTWEEVLAGQFIIIELNGVNSEPTHIYDQSTGFFQSLKDMCTHWSYIGKISLHQAKIGIKPLAFITFYQQWKNNQHL